MRSFLFVAAAAGALGLASAVGAAPVLAPTATPAASQAQLVQAAKQATVRVKSAVLRAGPTTKSKKLASLRRGAKVQVLDASGDWTHVRSGKLEGYVSSSLLSR